jgi:hypothetical protein
VFAVADAGAIWTLARLLDWLSNVRLQIGAGGMLAAALAMLVGARHRPLWILTAVAIAVFFFVDAGSIPFTGYGRFLAYSLLAVCGAVFAATYATNNRRALVIASAVIFVLQLPSTGRTFSLDFGPDHERNSLEWSGSLIRMPIRTLASKIATIAGDGSIRRLRVSAPGIDLISLPVAYPDLARQYALDTSTSDCGCVDQGEAVIAAFEWPANFANTHVKRVRFDQIVAACVTKMEATCAKTVMEFGDSSAIIGALGVGPR